MKLNWRKHALLAAAVASCMGTVVSASPFVSVSILGNTDDGSDWSSSLNVTAGETVYYEVIGELAQGNVTNSTKPYTLSQPQTAVTDGIGSLSLNLTDASSAAVMATPILDSIWNQGLGQTPGTASGNTVTGIEAAAASGSNLAATSAVQILTGNFTAGNASSDTLAASWNSSTNCTIKVNTTVGQKLIGVSGTTEIGNGTDPYVGYTALTLNEGPAAGTIAYMEAGSQGNASITGNATVITAITSQVGTWHGKTYSSYALLANDGTGSVDLYGNMTAAGYSSPTVGDVVNASGNYTVYDGFSEVSKGGTGFAALSVTKVGSSGTYSGTQDPLTATISQGNVSGATLPLSLASHLVTISSATLNFNGNATSPTLGTSNFTGNISDATGSEELYYWATSYSAPVNNFFGLPSNIVYTNTAVTGFFDIYTSGNVSTPEFNAIAPKGNATAAMTTLGNTSGAPSGVGSNQGALTVTSNGSGRYVPGFLSLNAPVSQGYVQLNGFQPGDTQIIALDVLVNGSQATDAQLAELAWDIDAENYKLNGIGGIASLLDQTSAASGLSSTLSGYNLLLTFAGSGVPVVQLPGGGLSAEYIGWNFSDGVLNDPNLTGVTVSEVAAVPEPASLGLLGLGGLALLGRRRKR